MTTKTLSLAGGLALKLASEHLSSVITNYQLAVYLFELYQAKKYEGTSIRVTKDAPDTSDLNRVKSSLIHNGIIQEQDDIGAGIFRYNARPNFGSEQVMCGVDPFAYISHLSAMAHYGLTDRIPKIIFSSTWDQSNWSGAAHELMEKQLNGHLEIYRQHGLPSLHRIALKSIHKQQVNIYTSSNIGSFIHVRDQGFRVSSIGRTFLDMLRRPDLCNGIHHVLDVFEEHAERYLRLIIDEVSQHGSKIERVRAGYILEDICKLKSDRIDVWVECAQRGGSRKLDPEGDYVSEFSEKWCLSLNVIR